MADSLKGLGTGWLIIHGGDVSGSSSSPHPERLWDTPSLLTSAYRRR